MISVRSPVEVRISIDTLAELLEKSKKAMSGGYERALFRSHLEEVEVVVYFDKRKQVGGEFELQPRRALTRGEMVSKDD